MREHSLPMRPLCRCQVGLTEQRRAYVWLDGDVKQVRSPAIALRAKTLETERVVAIGTHDPAEAEACLSFTTALTGL